jgi:hypothetical protein
MGQTTPGLIDKRNVDIDFPVTRGQAKAFLKKLPITEVEETPFYPVRMVELSCFALGVADLIDTDKGVQKYRNYEDVVGGFKGSAQLWKDWCDWCARHRMNYITNWPYGTGTNWWEMAVEPATAGMSVYSKEYITKAAKVRENLFKYAQSRGVKPLMMNYVAGAPNQSIKTNRPDLLGKKAMKQYPRPFCLSSPAVKEAHVAQIRAIMRTYPNLAGLHLRWVGESYPCDCEKCRGRTKELLADLLLEIIDAAREERKGTHFLLSGMALWGGEDFLKRLPEDAILQVKWGCDWEPTSNLKFPLEAIAKCPRFLIISQNMPTEEQQPIGGVLYKLQQTGMRRYVQAAKRIPNMAGWSIVLGEKDHQWITETNFIAVARLNWDPLRTDVEALIKNYIVTHYGKAAVEPVYQALDISQDVWNEYHVDFDGVVPFYVCSRLHSMFGLQRVKSLSPAELEKGLSAVSEHAQRMKHAVDLLRQVEATIKPQGRESFRDLLMQEQIFANLLASRKLLAEAFLAQKSRRLDDMAEGLRKVQSMDKRILELSLAKPNMADDFEMSGMTQPTHMVTYINKELKEIDGVLAPENMEFLRHSRQIYGQPQRLLIAGDVGTEKYMSLVIPSDLDSRIRSARFYFTVENAGGEKPGEEAEVAMLGVNFKVPPSGDGPHVYSFDVDPLSLTTEKVINVTFKLVGSAGDLRGYTAKDGRLVLELQKE